MKAFSNVVRMSLICSIRSEQLQEISHLKILSAPPRANELNLSLHHDFFVHPVSCYDQGVYLCCRFWVAQIVTPSDSNLHSNTWAAVYHHGMCYGMAIPYSPSAILVTRSINITLASARCGNDFENYQFIPIYHSHIDATEPINTNSTLAGNDLVWSGNKQFLGLMLTKSCIARWCH